MSTLGIVTNSQTDFIGGWHYYTLRRNADDTFDAWYDTTQVVVAETATDELPGLQ